MRRTVAIATLTLLGACTVMPPPGPRVMVLPGPGKTLAEFQRDDAMCRNYASAQTGYISPADAEAQSSIASAGVGTLVGAAAGTLLGAATRNAGVGAALGAGSGLLVGTAAGSNAARASSSYVQQRYDTSYLQCMVASGNRVPNVASPYVTYPGYYYPAY
jgi:hypothetical protein